MFTRKKHGHRSDSPEIELFREKLPIGRSCALTSLCEKEKDLWEGNDVFSWLGDRNKKICNEYYVPIAEPVMGCGIFGEFSLDPGGIIHSIFRAFPEYSGVPQGKVFAID